MCVYTDRDQDHWTLEPELQVVVSYSPRVLGPKLKSWARAEHICNFRAIFPALFFFSVLEIKPRELRTLSVRSVVHCFVLKLILDDQL